MQVTFFNHTFRQLVEGRQCDGLMLHDIVHIGIALFYLVSADLDVNGMK
jgi:hypothetical protein